MDHHDQVDGHDQDSPGGGERSSADAGSTPNGLSDRKLRSVLRVAPIGIGVVSNRVLLEVSDEICRMSGYSREELVGSSARVLYPDDEEFEFVGREKYRQISEKGTGTVDTRWRRKDGAILDVRLSSTPVDPDRWVDGVTFTALDITTARQTERVQRELAESEAKFRSIVEASPMGMHLYSLEPDGRLVLRGANPAADRILGLRHREIEGLTIEEAFPGLVDTEIPARYREVALKGTLWAQPHIAYRDGRIEGAYEVHAFQIAPGRMAAMFLDITARLRSEEALREKTEELDRFFSSALDLLCIADTDGHFRRLNPEWERTLGYRVEDLVGRRFLDFVHPDDLEPTLEAVARLSDQQVVLNFTNRYRHRDGSWRWIEWRSFPAGRIIYAAARDITERRRTDEALQASERLTRMVAELTSDYLFHLAVSPAGEISMDFVTGNFSDITGRTLDEVRTVQGWKTIIAPEDHDRLEAELRRLVVERRPAEMEMRSWVRGAWRWVRAHARPELDPTSQRVVGIIGGVKDISDQKAMEEERRRLQGQLQQAMKMEAIGRLAGGVAHDFNNLLTGILGNIDLVLMDLNPTDPLAQSLREVTRAAQSAADLTRQLLAFSRKQIIEPRVIDLNELIGRLHQMLVRLLGEDIELQTIPGTGLGAVRVDPGQFEQVVVNLAVNARDAMPDGGRLVVETANVDLDADYCAAHPHAPAGPSVMLAVSDNGQGMPPEVVQHLFEPFFTTKPKDRGTGLGLATSYGIVRQAGGSIEVYSEVGHGTTFKIYLPRVDAKVESWGRPVSPAALPGGCETILLVEDEGLVRNLAERILQRLGYRVLSATHGGDALLQAERHSDRIDLLVTDVIMPGMSGRELAHRLHALHPEMKVLYTSGYTDNVIVHHGVLEPGLRFLGKPYTAPGLAGAVRAALDGQ